MSWFKRIIDKFRKPEAPKGTPVTPIVKTPTAPASESIGAIDKPTIVETPTTPVPNLTRNVGGITGSIPVQDPRAEAGAKPQMINPTIQDFQLQREQQEQALKFQMQQAGMSIRDNQIFQGETEAVNQLKLQEQQQQRQGLITDFKPMIDPKNSVMAGLGVKPQDVAMALGVSSINSLILAAKPLSAIAFTKTIQMLTAKFGKFELIRSDAINKALEAKDQALAQYGDKVLKEGVLHFQLKTPAIWNKGQIVVRKGTELVAEKTPFVFNKVVERRLWGAILNKYAPSRNPKGFIGLMAKILGFAITAALTSKTMVEYQVSRAIDGITIYTREAEKVGNIEKMIEYEEQLDRLMDTTMWEDIKKWIPIAGQHWIKNHNLETTRRAIEINKQKWGYGDTKISFNWEENPYKDLETFGTSTQQPYGEDYKGFNSAVSTLKLDLAMKDEYSESGTTGTNDFINDTLKAIELKREAQEQERIKENAYWEELELKKEEQRKRLRELELEEREEDRLYFEELALMKRERELYWREQDAAYWEAVKKAREEEWEKNRPSKLGFGII